MLQITVCESDMLYKVLILKKMDERMKYQNKYDFFMSEKF